MLGDWLPQLARLKYIIIEILKLTLNMVLDIKKKENISDELVFINYL